MVRRADDGEGRAAPLLLIRAKRLSAGRSLPAGLSVRESREAMNYTFQFSEVFREFPYLLGGAVLTLEIAFLSFWLGSVIGLFGALGKVYGGGVLRRAISAYVIFFTNTPALVQIFFLFYALPDLGILLSPMTAVVIGITLNSGAYLTEILRAGVHLGAARRAGGGRDARHVAPADGAAT